MSEYRNPLVMGYRVRAPIMLSAILIALLIGGAGCATRTVTRIESGDAIDLSGKWNDTDSRLVAETMSIAITTHEWREKFYDATGRDPVVIVGTIHNQSSEHIDTAVFVKDIERALIESGRTAVVADSVARSEIRAEREDQQFNASESTRGRLIEEVGANFLLQGRIGSVKDRFEGRQVVFYQIDLELVDIQSNLKVWVGTREIRKFVVQRRTRF